MESNIGYYYDVNKRFLSLVGQWPYQKPKEKRYFFILILIILFNGIFTQTAHFFICEDAQCIYQTLPLHMFGVMKLVKILTFYFNKQKIKDLTDRLFMNWNILKNQEEREIMKKYTETGKWYALMYACYAYFGVILFASIALIPRILDIMFPLNTSRPVVLLYPAYYFVNKEKYFYYIFGHMFITAELGITGIIAHDSMVFAYIEHVCGLFAVTGYRFKHMSYKCKNVKKMMNNHSNDVYCKNIVFAVQAHREALQFMILLQNTFTLAFGIQILIVTVGMSITLVQLSMQLHDFGEALRYFVFIGGQLIHLFYYSFQGQKLINHSFEICDKIYYGSWYEIPITAQKLLLMVMKKSMEASTLTAGKIYVFSLQSFTTVLQASMSYSIVLLSLNK